MGRTARTSDARQKLLETADRLFYAEGVRAVGIDRVVAEAGVAKMSLYNHFPSKDDLILAVLKHRDEKSTEFFRAAIDRHAKKTGDKVRAFFAALKDWFHTPEFRGCAFQNAAVELADPTHPAAAFARDYKKRFGEFLAGLVAESLGRAAAKLAPAVNLLVEGAIVTAVVQGSPDAADVARDAALRLLGSAPAR